MIYLHSISSGALAAKGKAVLPKVSSDLTLLKLCTHLLAFVTVGLPGLLVQMPVLAQSDNPLITNPTANPTQSNVRTTQAPVAEGSSNITGLGAPPALTLEAVSRGRLANPESVPATGSPYLPSAIKADLASMNAVQQELNRLKERANKTRQAYVWQKAQRWLDVAQDEYRNNNRGPVPQSALAYANALLPLILLDNDASLLQAYRTPSLESAPIIRSDLWAKLDQIKATASSKTDAYSLAAQCAMADIAYTEVQLSWAAWINSRYGQRSAVPYIANAEKAAMRAQQAYQSCVISKDNGFVINTPPESIFVVQKLTEQELATITDAPPPIKRAVQAIELPSRVYFARNRSKLSLEGQSILDSVSNLLKLYPTLDISIEGYADDTGSASKNQALSLRRALVVTQYLSARGVQLPRILTVGYGAVREGSLSKSASAVNRRAQIMLSVDVNHPIFRQLKTNQTVPADRLRAVKNKTKN